MEWGRASRANLETCDPRLQQVLERVKDRLTERDLDCAVTCGYRGPEAQARAVEHGASFADFPQSAHNSQPSPAVDVRPHPVDWERIEDFYRLAAIVLHEAHELGIRLKWGGMFKRRGGRLFFDGPHFQLMED